MSQSDYLKSPMSLKSDDIDNISQHSDDMDDDLDRPPSPQLPLSLTTHERHRLSSTETDAMLIPAIKTERNRSRSPAPLSAHSVSHSGSVEQLHSLSEHNDPAADDTNDGGESATNARRSSSLKGSPQSEDLDMESDVNPMDDFRSPTTDGKRALPFPIVPNSMFSHSIMYMSHYIPQMGGQPHHGSNPSLSPQSLSQSGLSSMSSLSSDERRKRNRTFIDPVTEVPKLEQWFAMNTHPSHNLILKYTEDLNRMPYR